MFGVPVKFSQPPSDTMPQLPGRWATPDDVVGMR